MRTSARISVPNVVGLPQAQAEAAIRASGLSVGSISTSNPGTSSPSIGSVIGQNPPPGAQVDAGAAVAIVVRR